MEVSDKKAYRTLAIFCGLLLAFTLAAQQSTSLVITGQKGYAKVVQVQGHNYVDIDGLARLTNGSISFEGNQIVLALPGTPASDSSSPQPVGFSKQFLAAGIEAMSRVREWHTALKTGIERSVPLASGWLDADQQQARESMALASAAVSTDSDRSAYPLLVNVWNNMKALTDKYVQLSQSQTYFAPDSLQSDPLDQQIVTCGHSLSAMAAAKQFIDDGSCQ